jgi:hypothetical protein
MLTRLVAAQEKQDILVQFTGAVVAGDSLKAIPFAHIIDRTNGFSTISDFYGYFSFVAEKKDTIEFSATGYLKTGFVIPDTIQGDYYTMFQVMTADTAYRNETFLFGQPSEEQLHEYGIHPEFPDKDLILAWKNLEKKQLLMRVENMPMQNKIAYEHYIDETIRYLYPTREQFKEAFLHLKIPDDDLERARKNLDKIEMAMRADAMPMDGSMNYKYYIDKTVSKYYYAGQTPPLTVFNVFAWAEFFKWLKEGRFKRHKEKP